MSMPRPAHAVWPAAVVIALTGCGVGEAVGSAERCSGGGLYVHDRSPGAATPGAAVRAMADHKEAQIEKELETIPATEERDRRLVEDRVELRGLRALQSTADAGKGPGTYKANAEEGDVVASVDIQAAPSGGFLISGLVVEADCEPVT